MTELKEIKSIPFTFLKISANTVATHFIFSLKIVYSQPKIIK